MYCYHCMLDSEGDKYCRFCGKLKTADAVSHHLIPGTILNQKYLVGNALGSGGFGITYIGRDLTLDVKVAVKEFYPSGYVTRNRMDQSVSPSTESQREFVESGKERFLNEARSLAKFSDEKGVVFVRDYFEAGGTAYIVMEYLDGVNLRDYLRQHHSIDADTIFQMMLPIMSSLERMHSAGIIHRDISPDNIMYLRDGSLKLMDFGSARYFTNEENEMSVMVKRGFAPEEQYRRNGKQGPWTDVYGLCATIYKCITGVHPEESLNRLQVDELRPPSSLGVSISPKLEGVLMYGLAVYQRDRCKDMTELKGLVIQALNCPAGYPTELGGVQDPYRTHPAEDAVLYGGNVSSYGDYFSGDPKKSAAFGPPPETPPKKGRGAVVAVIIGIVVLLLVAVGVIIWLINDSSDKGASDSKSTAASENTEPTLIDPAALQSDVIKVPDVCGMSPAKAVETLSKMGLKANTVTVPDSSHEKNQVFNQFPTPDTEAKYGDEVTIYIAEGSEPVVNSVTESPAPASTEKKEEENVLYCCASEDATLRDKASRSGNKLAMIASREKVTYLATVGDFYKVDYKGTVGYVLADFFSPDPNAPLNYGTGNIDPTSGSSNTLYCRASDYVTLRSSPSTSASALDKIYTGDQVTYLGDSGQFIQVKYNGKTGYVLAKFFSDDPNAPLVYDDV